jgi:NAD(P)-dependent dehydrogenase (short-subunit alcohol dehydrogenase family)
MSKEKISNKYMKEQKVKHGWKKYPVYAERMVAITGAFKAGSIGKTIADNLNSTVRIYNEDVINGTFKFDTCTDLIMCHGVTYIDWLENMPYEKIKEIIDVNLYGSIRVLTSFVHYTIDSPYRKKIISIGSMAHNKVLNGSAAYCASKAGLNHFIKCAAWELAPKGYDVYIIHPSNVLDSPMSNDTINYIMKYRDISFEKAKKYWEASNPRDSALTKDEIVYLINFILSDKTGYLSGASIDLAGGQR